MPPELNTPGLPAAKGREVAKVLLALAVLYPLISTYEPPDFDVFLYPWVEHIRARGPIGAFAEPFANYTPPYLYLLTIFSLLPAPAIVVIKLLAIACLGWLAFGVGRLVQALGGEDPVIAGLFALCLPSVIFNGPVLGQCDALWAGACLLAVAASIERRTVATAAWASLAFAFKAQAAFIAPLMLAVVVRDKRWAALAFPFAFYFAAILPAWAAGWPLGDLLTVYLDQASLSFAGNAPNLWAIPALLGWTGTEAIAYVLAALAAAVCFGLLLARPLEPSVILNGAVLCSLALPFFLPKMHERFFFLAEMLAFVLAYWKRDRISIALCTLIQVATVLSLFAYLGPLPLLNAIGSLFMVAALAVATRNCLRRPDVHHGPLVRK